MTYNTAEFEKAHIKENKQAFLQTYITTAEKVQIALWFLIFIVLIWSGRYLGFFFAGKMFPETQWKSTACLGTKVIPMKSYIVICRKKKNTYVIYTLFTYIVVLDLYTCTSLCKRIQSLRQIVKKLEETSSKFKTSKTQHQ